MVLAAHDHVIDNLPTPRAHPSFGEPVLLWGPSRDSELRQTELSTRRSNAAPRIVSRSRINRASPMSGAAASTICCAAHSAGCRRRREHREGADGDTYAQARLQSFLHELLSGLRLWVPLTWARTFESSKWRASTTSRLRRHPQPAKG